MQLTATVASVQNPLVMLMVQPSILVLLQLSVTTQHFPKCWITGMSMQCTEHKCHEGAA